MDRDTALIILAVSIAAALAALLGERARARAPLAAHAHLPWRAVLFVALTAALFMVVHLLAAWRG